MSNKFEYKIQNISQISLEIEIDLKKFNELKTQLLSTHEFSGADILAICSADNNKTLNIIAFKHFFIKDFYLEEKELDLNQLKIIKDYVEEGQVELAYDMYNTLRKVKTNNTNT